MKYRIDLLHYTEGSGYTHTETIDNVDDINFDLIDYLNDYFSYLIVKGNEWYDAQLINNETEEILMEVFDVIETTKMLK